MKQLDDQLSLFFLNDNRLFMSKTKHACDLTDFTACSGFGRCNPPSFQISCNKNVLSNRKMYSLSLSLHGRTHIIVLASSKSIIPLKANIFLISLAAAKPIRVQWDGTLVKKNYCNPYSPLPTITFFIPSPDWKWELYACVWDKRQRQRVSVRERKKGSVERERGRKRTGKRLRESATGRKQ